MRNARFEPMRRRPGRLRWSFGSGGLLHHRRGTRVDRPSARTNLHLRRKRKPRRHRGRLPGHVLQGRNASRLPQLNPGDDGEPADRDQESQADPTSRLEHQRSHGPAPPSLRANARSHAAPTEIRKARRWRSRPRNAKGRRATILESEEEAKPPPQRERKEGNDSRKRGGGEAAPAALKKEAALIKIAHDQSGRGRGNLHSLVLIVAPMILPERRHGTTPQRGITSPELVRPECLNERFFRMS